MGKSDPNEVAGNVKVTMLVFNNLVDGGKVYPGDVVEVSQKYADWLIRVGHAEKYSAPAQEKSTTSAG